MRVVNIVTTTAAIAASLAFALAPAAFGAGLEAHATVSPGHASDILLSTDGTHFSRVLQHGLFSEADRIVPGSTRPVTLYIKNTSGRSTIMALQATHITVTSTDLAQALTVTASASNAAPKSANLGSPGSCLPLLTNVALAAGATIPVALGLSMSEEVAGATAQSELADLDVHVSLRDASEPALEGSGCNNAGADVPAFSGSVPPDAAPDGLADTGSNLYPPAIAIAALLAGGAFFTIAAKRRKRNETR